MRSPVHVLLVVLLATGLFASLAHAEGNATATPDANATASPSPGALDATAVASAATPTPGPLDVQIASPVSMGSVRYGSSVPLKVVVHDSSGVLVPDAAVSATLDGNAFVLTFDPVAGAYSVLLPPPAGLGSYTVLVTANGGESVGEASVTFNVVGASVALVGAKATDLKTVVLLLAVRDASGKSVTGLTGASFNVTTANAAVPVDVVFDRASGQYRLTAHVASTFAPVDLSITAAGLTASLVARVPPFVLISFTPATLPVGSAYAGTLAVHTPANAGIANAHVVVSLLKSDGVSRLDSAEGVTDASGSFPFTFSSQTAAGDSLSAVVYDPSGDASLFQLVSLTTDASDTGAAACSGASCLGGLPDASSFLPVLVNVLYLVGALALVLVAAGALVFVVTRVWRALHQLRLGADRKAKEESQIAELAAQSGPSDLSAMRSRRATGIGRWTEQGTAPRRIETGLGW